MVVGAEVAAADYVAAAAAAADPEQGGGQGDIKRPKTDRHPRF